MSATKPRPSLPKRPARAAVPPLPTFEMLDATHREVMRTLERLQQWVEQLDAQGIDDSHARHGRRDLPLLRRQRAARTMPPRSSMCSPAC